MPIAPIAFGDHQPKVFQSPSAAQDEAFRLLPGLRSFEFTNRNNFQFKTSFRRVNGLSFAAVSTPSANLQFADRIDPAFVFPYMGTSDFSVEGRLTKCQQHESATLTPSGFRSEVVGGARSVVVARLDADRLESTLATMLGFEGGGMGKSRFKTPTVVDLQPNGVSFDRVFRSLFSQIDALSNEPDLLNVSGIDDAFYRTLILATHRDVFTRQSEIRHVPFYARRLDRVCQYIASEQANTITLTDLERIGHMSRRTLHNAFMKTFGMSPMAWVREKRLLEANRRLKGGGTAQSVTQVLHACGFTSPSLFAAQYLKRFGELPSQTLSGARI